MHILKTVPVVALLLTQACFQIAHASMPSTKPRTYTAADGTVFVFDRSLRKWVIESASKVEAPEDGKQLLLKDRVRLCLWHACVIPRSHPVVFLHARLFLSTSRRVSSKSADGP